MKEKAEGITQKIYEQSDSDLHDEINSLLSGISKAMRGQTHRGITFTVSELKDLRVSTVIRVLKQKSFDEQVGQRREKALSDFMTRISEIEQSVEEVKQYI